MRVLVAEDERKVADAVARGLRREGIAVDVAYDGASALDKARLNAYDVVVLDRDLPELHGDEVCRTLRDEEPDSRVLMLTAAAAVDDLVDGLALGADDYMPKPFAFAELVARLRALGRRSRPAHPPTLRAGDVELDPARHTVTRAGRADRAGAEGVRGARGADGRRRRRGVQRRAGGARLGRERGPVHRTRCG